MFFSRHAYTPLYHFAIGEKLLGNGSKMAQHSNEHWRKQSRGALGPEESGDLKMNSGNDLEVNLDVLYMVNSNTQRTCRMYVYSQV